MAPYDVGNVFLHQNTGGMDRKEISINSYEFLWSNTANTIYD